MLHPKVKASNHISWISVSIICLLLAGVQGCKKGEDDPLISFRSRNNRLDGAWRLSKAEGVFIETTTNNYRKTDVSLQNNLWQERFNDSALIVEEYSLELVISKAGDFAYTEENYTGGGGTPSTLIASGLWHWKDSARNKDGIQLNLTPTKLNLNLDPNNPFQMDRFEITKLKHKEMVWKYRYEEGIESGTAGETKKLEWTLTFKQ